MGHYIMVSSWVRQNKNKVIWTRWRHQEIENTCDVYKYGTWSLNGSQLAKFKKRVFFSCYFHEMYSLDAVSLSIANRTFKNKIFVNMWNLGQSSWKIHK